jgi:hypothetical protein
LRLNAVLGSRLNKQHFVEWFCLFRQGFTVFQYLGERAIAIVAGEYGVPLGQFAKFSCGFVGVVASKKAAAPCCFATTSAEPFPDPNPLTAAMIP